jgi:hypothetical protein
MADPEGRQLAGCRIVAGRNTEMRCGKCLLAAGLAVLIATTGCVLRGPRDVPREISRATGAQLEREFEITLGRVGMALSRWGMRIADVDDDFSPKGIRKIEVGIYQVTDQGSGDLTAFRNNNLASWEPVVAVREEDEDVLVMLREKKGEVRGMLVVVSEPEELVVVRMRGRLDNFLEDAMELGFRQAGHHDLYAVAVDEMHDGDR